MVYGLTAKDITRARHDGDEKPAQHEREIRMEKYVTINIKEMLLPVRPVQQDKFTTTPDHLRHTSREVRWADNNACIAEFESKSTSTALSCDLMAPLCCRSESRE